MRSLSKSYRVIVFQRFKAVGSDFPAVDIAEIGRAAIDQIDAGVRIDKEDMDAGNLAV
jgi:hypothetical protein